MKHQRVRGIIRSNTDCDMCRRESKFLFQIGFSEDRDLDRKYCEICKNDLFYRISLGKELKIPK